MQVDTKVKNSTYYERSSTRYAENEAFFSFAAGYTETNTVSRSYEGRKRDAVGAYEEMNYRNAVFRKAEDLMTMLDENSALLGESGDADYIAALGQMMEEILHKLEKGDTEQEFQIGASAFSFQEWDEFLQKFDEQIEEVRETIREEIAKRTGQDMSYVTTEDKADLLTAETSVCSYPSGTQKEETKYITMYTETGITCRKAGMTGEEYEWKILFENREQYEKVMGLLGKFPSDYNFRFAAHQNFWEDYLKGDIEETEFLDFMKSTHNGIPDYAMGEEDTIRIDESKIKWAKYLNHPEARMNTGMKLEEQVSRQIVKEEEKAGKVRGLGLDKSRKRAPYDYLAEDGIITYKGVTFLCDTEKNRITLGDVRNPNNCLKVALKGGGVLMANYDNLDDLTKAITMFSPEDQARIMYAITIYKMSKRAQKELEDMKAGDEESVS